MNEGAPPPEPPAPPARPPRAPSAWDRVARWLALFLLIAILTVVYWVPFQLVGVWGAAVAMAMLTIGFVALSSRVWALRKRVVALEERLAPPDQK